jgi:two-component system, response regulator PdtaR
MAFPNNAVAVLVVDDEPLVRMDLASTIEDAGFRVYEAANADDAIALLETREDIRAVVTDIEMPGSLNGLELAHYAHASRSLKIIVASGKRNVSERDLPPGAVFLPKPLKPAHLVDNLRAIAGGRPNNNGD